MGWKCKECLNDNSYRYKLCLNCNAPISENEIKRIISDEISLQQHKIITLLIGLLDRFSQALENYIIRRKKLNVVSMIILITILFIYYFYINGVNSIAMGEHISDIAINKKQIIMNSCDAFIDRKIAGLKQISKKKYLFLSKKYIIASNIKETLNFKMCNTTKLKKVRKIQIKTLDPSKINHMEVKLWEAVTKIQSLF